MIDVAMNNGDFIVSNFGDLALHLSDSDNIVQMCNNAISTIRGENIFHSDYGNDAWNKRLKISESGLRTIESCSKEAILYAVDSVSEVSSITAVNGGNYECLVSYTIVTTDGETISSKTSINIL